MRIEINNGIVISSDWHIRKRTWSSIPKIENDSFESLSQIINLQLERGLDHIILGDVFDTNLQNTENVFFVREMLHKVHKAGLKTIYIQGQHEMVTSKPGIPWLMVCSSQEAINCGLSVHGDDKSILINGKVVHFMDFAPPSRVVDKLKSIPADVEILATHQVWVNLINKSLSEADFFLVPDNISQIWTGDFHSHFNTVFENDSGRKIRVVSPGAIFMNRIGEPSESYVFVLDRDMTTFESIKLNTRPILEYSVSSQEGMEKSLNDYLASIDKFNPPPSISGPLVIIYTNLPDIRAMKEFNSLCLNVDKRNGVVLTRNVVRWMSDNTIIHEKSSFAGKDDADGNRIKPISDYIRSAAKNDADVIALSEKILSSYKSGASNLDSLLDDELKRAGENVDKNG